MVAIKRAGYIFLALLAGFILLGWTAIVSSSVCVYPPCGVVLNPLAIPLLMFFSPLPYGVTILALVLLFVGGLVISRRNYWIGFALSLSTLIAALVLTWYTIPGMPQI